MPSAAPLTYQHLDDEKGQRNGEEIHILFVVFLEDCGVELLVLETADVVDNGIEAELVLAGTDILSAVSAFSTTLACLSHVV